MRYKVKKELDILHAGEIGESYAYDNKRIYLRFADGDKMGYLPEQVESCIKLRLKSEKEMRRDDILKSTSMILLEARKNRPQISIIEALIAKIEHDVLFM